MKKHVVIPFGICLFLIALSGFFLYRKYEKQVEARKELLVQYVSETNVKLNAIALHINELPYIVRSFIGERGMMDADIDNQYHDDISLLEQFYIRNNYFIKQISVYDRHGDVFNIYRDKTGDFIHDIYRPRSISVPRSEPGIVIKNNSISIVNPVYQRKVLAGNVEVSLNVDSLQYELFKSCLENGNIWLTTVFNEETTQTLPLDGEWALSHERDISWGVWDRKSGFAHGKIKGRESSAQVVTYYESLLIPDQSLGIAFSYNISPLIVSSLITFAVFVIILVAIAFAVSFIMNRMMNQHRFAINEKNQEIRLLQLIFSCAPAGIIVNRDNSLFAANNCFFTMLDGYLSLDDVGKEMEELNFPPSFYHQREQQEFEEWDLYKFERNGKEICLGRRQMNFDMNANRYMIDTFWDVTEMEQRLKDAIHSEITKSELLSRVSVEVKKTLGNAGNAVALLKQQFPEEEHVAYVNNTTANLSMLIDEVQDYANIEAGGIVLDEIPFNLVDEIKKVTDMFQPEAKRKGIELHAHVASSATRNVVSDPQRFRQILTELLSNAVKFTTEGSIRISLETTELQGRKSLIKCSVEDTGQGMPREKLKKLFLFDLRAKEETEPIGLGIIIIRKLVNMMGGTLRASSPSPISTNPLTPGMQFSFTITCFSDQPLDKQLDYSSIALYRQVNVLIVTSDAFQMQFLINFLSRQGIQSDVFIYNKDSDELLINKLIIDKTRYQLVIISAATSEMTFSIAEEIHSKELTGNCLYVFVDAFSQRGNYVKAKALNMDYYFVKSSDISVYDEILKTHFPNLSDAEVSENELVRKDLRILIAENNELSQKVAKVIFGKLGYEVDLASNALFLINHLNRKSYDVIFIDLKFPPNDGFEMTDVLRVKDYKMPIIAMTSTLTRENLKRISESGMDGYVSKPLNPDNIMDILKRYVR